MVKAADTAAAMPVGTIGPLANPVGSFTSRKQIKWLRPCRRPQEFNYKFGSNSGGGRRGGCAPPHPPAFPGGFAPWTPQKALRALGCSGCSLSRDRTTCPGQNFSNFSGDIRLFLKKPLVRGSFAAWGRTFLPKLDFFCNKPLVPGSFAAWDCFRTTQHVLRLTSIWFLLRTEPWGAVS